MASPYHRLVKVAFLGLNKKTGPNVIAKGPVFDGRLYPMNCGEQVSPLGDFSLAALAAAYRGVAESDVAATALFTAARQAITASLQHLAATFITAGAGDAAAVFG